MASTMIMNIRTRTVPSYTVIVIVTLRWRIHIRLLSMIITPSGREQETGSGCDPRQGRFAYLPNYPPDGLTLLFGAQGCNLILVNLDGVRHHLVHLLSDTN
jgi:hypothetical protein